MNLEPDKDSLAGRGFTKVQYFLPQHAISRLTNALTRVRAPWLKNGLIRGFLRLYTVDMSEAAVSNPLAYSTFNEFFTRALQAGARPLDDDERSVASPVDGTVSECGAIDQDSLLQAKGHVYSLDALLAGQSFAREFANGVFCTIYLAPHNYHRIHMPLRGALRSTVYVPGRLFSVNTVTSRHVPGLFARNERVITLFDTAAGPMAVVLVGALNVGSMATVWAGDITPAKVRRVRAFAGPELTLAKGEELGRFNMGSTVILLFARGRVSWAQTLCARQAVRLGAKIGRIEACP